MKSHILHDMEVTWVPARMVSWENVIILLLFIIIRLVAGEVEDLWRGGG